jgi:hypothetical protein
MNTKETKSTKNIYLINIQKFFNFFYKSKAFHKMSSTFKSEPLVFENESQLPDLWLKTRTPFDKNIAFKYYGRKGTKSFQKWKIRNLNLNIKPNYFPIVPLLIPFENELITRQVQVKNLSVENLFSENSDLEFISKKQISTPAFGDIKINFPSVNHPKKEEFLLEKLSEKSWNISFFHLDQHINYGPLTSFKIFVFLKNMYSNLSLSEKNRKNFMIVDMTNDVYFQPDTLYEILVEEFEKKKEFIAEEKILRIKQNFEPGFNIPTNSKIQNILRPLVPGVYDKFNSKSNGEEKSSLIEINIRKNSNVSSGSNISNGLSTKYSSARSDENIIVGLDPKKIRRGKRFRAEGKSGLACENQRR